MAKGRLAGSVVKDAVDADSAATKRSENSKKHFALAARAELLIGERKLRRGAPAAKARANGADTER